MKLLVVAATQMELAPFFTRYNLTKGQFLETAHFDILITGVGMTATAFALGRYLTSTYALVLNVGIAGSFDQTIPLGSVVNIQHDTFEEFGAEDHDRFISIDELGFGTSQYEASYAITGLPNVSAITVNKVHGSEQSINLVAGRLNPTVESMEGAAVFYACSQMDIPCAQVRAISNYVTPRNKSAWQVGPAIGNLNNWLADFIAAIK